MGHSSPMADPPDFIEQHRRACRAKLRVITAEARVCSRLVRSQHPSEVASIAVWRRKGLGPRDATLLVLQTRAAEAFR